MTDLKTPWSIVPKIDGSVGYVEDADRNLIIDAGHAGMGDDRIRELVRIVNDRVGLVELLRSLEWTWVVGGCDLYCHSCSGDFPNHDAGCVFAAAIGLHAESR